MPSKNTAWLRAAEAAARPRVPHALPRQHTTPRPASRTSPCRFRLPRGWGCRRFYPFQMVEARLKSRPHLYLWGTASALPSGAHVRMWARASALPSGAQSACGAGLQPCRWEADQRANGTSRITGGRDCQGSSKLLVLAASHMIYDAALQFRRFRRRAPGLPPRSAGSLARASRAALRSAHVHSPQSSLNCRRHR
jgi:hypothetical protein